MFFVAQYRSEKFTKKLFGESEIEIVLQRLDRLTQDEARITAAQTLGVVHGLVNNMKVVMEGTQFFDSCLYFLNACSSRRKGINKQHSTGFR